MIYLHGVGHFHPENVITNAFLESLDIGTTVDWILERVGIETRRTILPLDYIRETKNARPWETDSVRLYSNAQMAAAATRLALKRAGIGLEDIGMVISGSSLPQFLTPPEAATVAGCLGIDVPCFDINAACATFGAQMGQLDSLKPEKTPPYILVTNIECPTPSTDYSDRRTAVLFGDCATATILSLTVPSNKIFAGCEMTSKPTLWDKAVVPRWSYFAQDGNAVQGFAIRKTTDSLRSLLALYPDVNRDLLYFAGHQANLGVLTAACERAGIPPERHWHNVEFYGNVGSASVPCLLSEHWEDLCPGNHVAIAIVGAGLAWAQMMLTIQ